MRALVWARLEIPEGVPAQRPLTPARIALKQTRAGSLSSLDNKMD